jgi:hypothetical protein
MPMAEKRRFGKLIIDNNGTEAALEAKVMEICRQEFALGPEQGKSAKS